jgi:hypothetical protein
MRRKRLSHGRYRTVGARDDLELTAGVALPRQRKQTDTAAPCGSLDGIMTGALTEMSERLFMLAPLVETIAYELQQAHVVVSKVCRARASQEER